jgi:hypothetical protein
MKRQEISREQDVQGERKCLEDVCLNILTGQHDISVTCRPVSLPMELAAMVMLYTVPGELCTTTFPKRVPWQERIELATR